jgi:hypothetical protein
LARPNSSITETLNVREIIRGRCRTHRPLVGAGGNVVKRKNRSNAPNYDYARKQQVVRRAL